MMFFFFKQKTAYDVRISDWSSDVCSSDLWNMKPNCIAAVAQVYGREPTAAEIRNIEVKLARSMRAEASADPQAWLALPLADQLQSGDTADTQNGRPTCRERVCQYGEISVVAGALKKTQKNKTNKNL